MKIISLFLILASLNIQAETSVQPAYEPIEYYRCSSIFFSYSKLPKSAHEFMGQVTAEHDPSILPKFLSRQQDIETSRRWKGANAPTIIQSALPDGVTAIDHQLFQAQPGVVKSDGTGVFASARAEFKYHGDVIGTNVGVNTAALVENVNSPDKFLARKKAKAVVLFLHGGGTKGTGHHVAINILNYFNKFDIDVIAVDNPWHAEGARHTFQNVDEYIDYLIEFVHKYVPPGVPVVIAGHSLGGAYADMILRRSDKNPQIKETFAAAIPLSPVADLAPGKSVREKIQAEVDRGNALLPGTPLFDKMSEDDKNLGDQIVVDGKVSPIAWFEIQNMLVDSDWTLPKDNGANYIPSLYIMGKGDGLYVGLEDHFQKYVGNLKNSKFVLFGEAVDFKKTKYLVGHLIFDNISEDGTPETFTAIRDFIFDVTQQKDRNPVKFESNPLDSVQKLIGTYLNNLAFRKFIAEFTIDRKAPKKSGLNVDARLEVLNNWIRGPVNGKAPEPALDFHGKPLSIDDAKIEQKSLVVLRSDKFVPNDSRKELAEYLIKARDDVSKEISFMTGGKGPIKALKLKQTALSLEKQRKERQFYSYFNIYMNGLRGKSTAEIDEAIMADVSASSELRNIAHASVEKLKELKGLLDQMTTSGGDYLVNLIENNKRNSITLINLPLGLQQLFASYMEVERDYLNLVRDSKETYAREARAGRLGLELKAKYDELWAASGLQAQSEKVSAELAGLDTKLNLMYQRRADLTAEYSHKINNEYFDFVSTQALDVLNLGYAEFMKNENLSMIQKMMGEWTTLWVEKPPADSVSLY